MKRPPVYLQRERMFHPLESEANEDGDLYFLAGWRKQHPSFLRGERRTTSVPSQSNGLRFDIYERVHLPDEVAAIDELDEIELVPRIGIVQQDEQVLLKGHLLLTGVYRSEDEPLSEQSLEHWIPVEITLPLNRIHRLDDIAVEIDNFDVDVLSTRTLNITGVLSLFGIEIEQASPAGEWEREEPYTVVHRRDEEALEAPSYPFFAQQPQLWDAHPQSDSEQQSQADQEQQLLADAEQERRTEEETAALLRALQEQGEAEEAREALARAAEARERELLQAAMRESASQEADRHAEQLQEAAFQEEEREAEAQQPELASPTEIYVSAPDQSASESFAAEGEFEPELPAVLEQEAHRSPPAVELPQASFGEVSVHEQDAEPKQLKVALAGKSVEDETAQTGNVSFRSLLQSSRREQEAKIAAEQLVEREAAQARKTSGDEIEWKNLFYGRPSDENSFRKVRICIVQREETLDAIAGRYQLQPREIALYNRLSDQSINEGQVLYIPS